MSELRDIKKIVLATPNDADLGAKIRQYVAEHEFIHISCCEKPNNMRIFTDEDSHPYGRRVSGTKCAECGKIISTIID